jgi:hypothetical protein
MPMGDDSLKDPNLRPSLSPMLSVRRGAKAVEFYKATFGAAELFKIAARCAWCWW